jgi:hypothetical protein
MVRFLADRHERCIGRFCPAGQTSPPHLGPPQYFVYEDGGVVWALQVRLGAGVDGRETGVDNAMD